MLVTISATTVPTVRYLSLSELENYKKQFQSFWIPFMEQFVPATTIWVAGERWCNEPCTIINPCDYDYEFVEASISLVPTVVPATTGSTTQRIGFVTSTLPSNVAVAGSLGTPTASNPPTSTEINQVVDLGLSSSVPVIRTQAEVTVDILSYRDRFTELTTETIIL